MRARWFELTDVASSRNCPLVPRWVLYHPHSDTAFDGTTEAPDYKDSRTRCLYISGVQTGLHDILEPTAEFLMVQNTENAESVSVSETRYCIAHGDAAVEELGSLGTLHRGLSGRKRHDSKRFRARRGSSQVRDKLSNSRKERGSTRGRVPIYSDELNAHWCGIIPPMLQLARRNLLGQRL